MCAASGPSINVGEFFSGISAGYDESIIRGCPPYAEMMEELLLHLFLDTEAPLNIVELGCGTGNLSRLIAARFPNASLTLVDLSPEMLKLASEKLKKELQTPSAQNLKTLESDFNKLNLANGSVDLFVSSIALHHLLDPDKAALYKKLFTWLKSGGKFRCADECLSLPADVAGEQNFHRWIAWATEKGASKEELDMWYQHALDYDHYAPIHHHLKWLETAGFTNIDCYWRKIFWTVFGADRP